MARGRTKELEWYGLKTLKYGKSIPITGHWLADQLRIECIAFRIAHMHCDGGLGKFGHFRRIVDLLWNNKDQPSPKRFIWNSWAEKMLRKACECDELGVAGPTSAGKSDPFALWAVVNYVVDPTHTRVLVMSTSIGGAKLRIWKTLKEYINALPEYPGKPLWSTNQILGPEYSGKGYSESAGILLLAGEKSKEKDALEKMIGIKAPATGDADESLPALRRRPEYADIVRKLEPDVVDRLLPELAHLSSDRTGKLILIIDEATGVSEAIRNAINVNMKPAHNKGRFQCIMIGNPNLHWDTHGLFCAPAVGWENVTLADDEWETVTGGTCIRFNGEKSPRIVDGNEKYHWMQSQEDLDSVAAAGGGKKSLMYYRFALGFWCPQGVDSGVYSQADIEQSGAMGKGTVWGFDPPKKLSSLDPSFTVDGDKPACTFGSLGKTQNDQQVLEVTETIAITVDASDTATPVSYQVARNWRRECEKRGIPPENACFDSSGAPSFADIIHKEWSPLVQAINTQGKASIRPVGSERNPDGSKVKGTERFGNKVTEIWYGAHPFFSGGQIRGITNELAKGICSRKLDIRPEAQGGRTIKVESKRKYKSREGHSPDDEDSFFNLVEHARSKHGFRPAGKVAAPDPSTPSTAATWEAFKKRARRIHIKTNLPR